MKQLISDTFLNEQEYYQALVQSVRQLMRAYITSNLDISDAGLLRHNGGVEHKKGRPREKVNQTDGNKTSNTLQILRTLLSWGSPVD